MPSHQTGPNLHTYSLIIHTPLLPKLKEVASFNKLVLSIEEVRFYIAVTKRQNANSSPGELICEKSWLGSSSLDGIPPHALSPVYFFKKCLKYNEENLNF